MAKELILEIGTEEIPAGFLTGAIEDLRSLAIKLLGEHNLAPGGVSAYGTPRRLTLRVASLEEKQPTSVRQILGPPRRIAFDESGDYTPAALGFARKQGADPAALEMIETEKGEFLGIRRTERGERTREILKTLLPELILSIPFRKSMRWGEGETTFVRPIRWILAVFGGRAVRFTLGGTESGNRTRGHRFLAPGSFAVKTWKDYEQGLRRAFVIVDPAKREAIITRGIERLTKRLGGYVEDDPELLDTVTNLVEYPVVLTGGFEGDFLSLPGESLISVMKNHQKYFPIYKASGRGKGRLLPCFIFVSGTRVKRPAVVTKGNERVIRARFTDARFFYEADTRGPLEAFREPLRDMVFLSGLGSYYEKTSRLAEISGYLAGALGLGDAETRQLVRAAELCKADLSTQMVFEFPELEGTMGRYYALESGEGAVVAAAIEEHYMPRGRDAGLPGSEPGALLSLADKIDNITACFAAGLAPTGTSDPYALRRQAIAMINIIGSRGYSLSLAGALGKGAALVGSQALGPDEALVQSLAFVTERLRHILIAEGSSADVVEAVISTGADDVIATRKKVEAVRELARLPDFESLATAFKRVVNIAKTHPGVEIDRALFGHETEGYLFGELTRLRGDIKQSSAEGDFKRSLELMRALKEPVDRFFDDVLVMDKDEAVRSNRLALLWAIRELFFTVADFSRISTT